MWACIPDYASKPSVVVVCLIPFSCSIGSPIKALVRNVSFFATLAVIDLGFLTLLL